MVACQFLLATQKVVINSEKWWKQESMYLFSISVVRRLSMTQLFSKFVTTVPCPPSGFFFTFCEIIDLPHFGGGDPQNWAYDLKFKLGQDFCIMHLLSSFVNLCLIVQKLSCLQTNKQMNIQIHKQRDFVENIHLALPLCNAGGEKFWYLHLSRHCDSSCVL